MWSDGYRAVLAVVMLGLMSVCAAATPDYGPLTYNTPGADFYFAQDGKMVPVEQASDGVLVVHLSSRPFQLGYNGRQMNLALAQVPIEEVSTDPQGYKASRLSGPMSGGREENSDALLVYGGRSWSDGNTEFSDDTSRKAPAMEGFAHSYVVNVVDFLADEKLTLATFKGTLYGYIVVYKQPERVKRDIMPVRLVFE